MANDGRIRFEFTMDEYTNQKLDMIMESGLFVTKAEAVKAAIVELAHRVKDQEHHDDGVILLAR